MPYLAGTLAEHLQGVVAHLVAQAPRAGMDHHADAVLLQAHGAGGRLVEHFLDHLHFEEMVAGAERAALIAAALRWRGG